MRLLVLKISCSFNKHELSITASILYKKSKQYEDYRKLDQYCSYKAIITYREHRLPDVPFEEKRKILHAEKINLCF
jgi:hypothetical protein